jgi:hypothetical protein
MRMIEQVIGTARSHTGGHRGWVLSREADMQRNEHGGGGVPVIRRTPAGREIVLRVGTFGVDGSVARQVAREVESIEARSREQSWLSTSLSRGLSGTRIA